jgi:mRNA interferase RelE/StbE
VKYAFRFTAVARRDLRAIDRDSAMRILTALTALGDDPYARGLDVTKLTGYDLYRLRVGRYRLIYQVHDGELLILLASSRS